MPGNDRWSDVSDTFAALSAISSLLSGLFAAPPDENMFVTLQDLDSEESVLLNDEDPDWTQGLWLLAGYCRGSDPRQRLLTVIGDHSRLFVGPTHVYAPPWASVHMNIGLLQGPATQEILAAYRSAGLQPLNADQEPPDHIAVELDFVAELDRRIAEATGKGDLGTASQSIAALRGFLGSYVDPWLDRFLDLVEKHAETDFYRGLGRVTRAAVAMQRAFSVGLAPALEPLPA